MWDIDQDDVLYKLISNVNSTFEIEKLFDGTTERSQMGKIRKKLGETLGIEEDELKCILKQIRIKSRQEKLDDLMDGLNRQLENQGLQVMTAQGIV